MPESKSHPRGLYVLFFAELWERFSFYGMRALLTLYMTKQLISAATGNTYDEKAAYGVYAAYGALVYALPVIGGLMADRLLGYRRAIILGGSLMALGHFTMAFENEYYFYLALALICLGNGFFKPNISSLVGKLYGENDPRRDSGFTIFYMGINIGALLAPLACGYVGETWGWHYGFGLAGVGMVIGLVCFLWGTRHLLGHGEPPDLELLRAPSVIGVDRQSLTIAFSVLAAPLLAVALWQNAYVGYGLYGVGGAVLLSLILMAVRNDAVARDRMFVIILLMFFHTLFWALFEQAGSSLTIFTDRHVDRRILGDTEVPASQFQSLNPFFIVALAPLFAMLWTKLGARGRNPSIPAKFSLGLAQLGLGYLVLGWGAGLTGDGEKVAVVWLMLMYLLHTMGELCISPVGLSAITKLSIPKAVGTVMGAWFLSISFAHHFAGMIAKLTTAGNGEGSEEAVSSATEAVAESTGRISQYTDVYSQVGLIAIVVAALLFIATPLVKKLTHGVS